MSAATRLATIGFDADDTLWHNEQFYRLTEERFVGLLADHAEPDHLSARLLEAEKRNIGIYGFGIKGFTLSMIETAIEVTEGRVPGAVIAEILAAGRDMLAHPVELLANARETVEALAGGRRLVLITKGDLFDQERKVAQSGLGEMFSAVEIVSAKTPETYRRIFDRFEGGAEQALMVGNSLKSDVIPALRAGSWGVHVPQELLSALEHAEPPVDQPRFRRIADLGELPALVEEIEQD